MPEETSDFSSLPEEYQDVIRLAQEKHDITVMPLQVLVGGWSGAMVYLVSVSSNETQRVEHCILKLDRKGKSPKADEVTRHSTVLSKSTPEFARQHIAELAFEQVEDENTVAIFYRIAGQSLLAYLPLSRYAQQSQLETIFRATNTILLSEWNVNLTIEQSVHPQQVLEKWLGFRLDAGKPIEGFLQNDRRGNPDKPGFLINGAVYPNPLRYARTPIGTVVEADPQPTENPRARGHLTARIYRVFEAVLSDPALGRVLLEGSERVADGDVRGMAEQDVRSGGKGRANAVLSLPLNALAAFYQGLPLEARDEPVVFAGHRLEATVPVVLEGIAIPRYVRL